MSTETPPRKPFVVRDPIHGYIRIAAHERIVVDHPITQRLRGITQTGLAHFVWPAARTSRFDHSLGAMHLASRLFSSCIEHASTQPAKKFLGEWSKQVKEVAPYTTPEAVVDQLVPDECASGLLLERIALHSGKFTPEDRCTLLLAEAALRLAALFHDLGHLPFSHDFEFALKDFPKEDSTIDEGLLTILAADAPHETIGHQLAHLCFISLIENHGAGTGTQTIYRLAQKILNCEPPTLHSKLTALEWLHTLIDGELDCDRADYLLRDARSLDFIFAQYDLERLLGSVALTFTDEYGFETVVHERGLPAIESFFVSRARSNQLLVRHHKVAQTGAAFRHVTRECLRNESTETKEFLETLSRIGASKDFTKPEYASKILDTFSYYDDGWWIQVLRSASLNSDMFTDCRGLVLHRSPTLVSLWKRKGDLDDITAINKAADGKFESGDGQFSLKEKVKQCEDKGVLLALHSFRPYRKALESDGTNGLPPRSLFRVLKSNGSLVALSEASPLVAALWRAWQCDVHLHAFARTAATSDLKAGRSQALEIVSDTSTDPGPGDLTADGWSGT